MNTPHKSHKKGPPKENGFEDLLIKHRWNKGNPHTEALRRMVNDGWIVGYKWSMKPSFKNSKISLEQSNN